MFLTIVSMTKFVTMVTRRMAVLCLCHESVLWMGNCFSECRRNAPRHQLMTRGLATWSYHDNRWQDKEELILPSFTSNQSTHGVQEMQISISLSSFVLLFFQLICFESKAWILNTAKCAKICEVFSNVFLLGCEYYVLHFFLREFCWLHDPTGREGEGVFSRPTRQKSLHFIHPSFGWNLGNDAAGLKLGLNKWLMGISE